MTSRSFHEKDSIEHTEHFRHEHPHRQPAVSLTPEQYERLFLQPGPPPPGTRPVDLSRQFANPTPLGVISFLLVLTPTSCFLLSFDHTDASSAIALSGVYFLIGGLGLFTAGILEWILGNTFPFVVFCTFGGFWLNFGFLNDPVQGITQAFQGGTSATDYNTGTMFYWIFWTVVDMMYFLASFRVNIVFVFIFGCLLFNFSLLAATYHQLGHGNTVLAATLLKVGGGFGLAAAFGGWYFGFGHMMAAVEMPFTVPYGDLSTRFLTGKRGLMRDMEDNGARRD